MTREEGKKLKRGDVVWTQSRKSGNQHRWMVLVPMTLDTFLGRNELGIQRDLRPEECQLNPADL